MPINKDIGNKNYEFALNTLGLSEDSELGQTIKHTFLEHVMAVALDPNALGKGNQTAEIAIHSLGIDGNSNLAATIRKAFFKKIDIPVSLRYPDLQRERPLEKGDNFDLTKL